MPPPSSEPWISFWFAASSSSSSLKMSVKSPFVSELLIVADAFASTAVMIGSRLAPNALSMPSVPSVLASAGFPVGCSLQWFVPVLVETMPSMFYPMSFQAFGSGSPL